MCISLPEYWRSQRRLAGRWVHPDDADLIARDGGIRDSFNFDFPAVPFNGDPSAPVVLLLANGGWDDIETPREFQSECDVQRHLERLSCPESADWRSLCPYYQRRNYFDLIKAAKLVAVNLCGYRSQRVPGCVGRLNSAKVHQRWLSDEVMPEVKAGKRFLVAHRYGQWLPVGSDIRKEVEPWLDGTHGIRSRNSISPNPSQETMAAIDAFLAKL